MAQCFLVLGSNDDAEQNLRRCVALLRKTCAVVAVSPVYESAAVGKGQGAYLNAAVQLTTDLQPEAFRQQVVIPIEEALQRDRSTPGRVSMDIDIALWSDAALTYGDKPRYLPHPDILRYRHAAQPLADLAPTRVHPTDGRPLAGIAASLPGELQQRNDIKL